MSRAPAWLRVAPVDSDLLRSISDELDLGERSAIALATTIAADLLLIDEAAGRSEAKRHNLRVTGTLGVLRAAAELGLLDAPNGRTTMGRLGRRTGRNTLCTCSRRP